MPVSLKLLRRDEGVQEALRQSISLRRKWFSTSNQGGSDGDQVDQVERVVAADRDYRQALGAVETARSRRRRRSKAMDCSEAATETEAQLSSLEGALEGARDRLKGVLNDLPNFVDLEVSNLFPCWRAGEGDRCTARCNQTSNGIDSSSRSSSGRRRKRQRRMEDVMFCLGGYERLPPGEENDSDMSDNMMAVLTGSGIYLENALQNVMQEWLLLSGGPLTDCYNQSESARASQSLYHNLKQWRFPYSPDVNKRRSALLQHKKGETLFDRALPDCHVFSCSSKPSHDCCSNPLWFEEIESEQVNVVLLTGSVLHVDSRPLQVLWITQLQKFYQSLLLSIDGGNACASEASEIVAVPPEQLDASESSRLVLLGKFPALPNEGEESSTPMRVVLAHLSNVQDYCSPHIRHGNSSNNSKDAASVHVVHGMLSRHATTLAWMLAWNRASSVADNAPRSEQTPVVKLAEPICRHMPPQVLTDGELPYVRRISFSNKGKQIIQEFAAPARPPSLLQASSPMPADVGGSRQANAQRIQGESLSCPFFFFPFYDYNGEGSS